MMWQSEREDEAQRLRDMKPNVIRFSKFGDDHHDAIDAQVWVLEKNPNEAELLDEARDEGWAENVFDAAIEAYRWILEDNYAAPSEDWKSLLNDNPSPAEPAQTPTEKK